ncbi:MAG: sulfotransferase family 2 domain-containing protein [Colwellia sp.]
MRLVTLKQRINKTLGRKNLYKDFFDKNSCVFIHIPKAAGTAVSNALYGDDPWHYSVDECRFIDSAKFDRYYKFAVVRHPVSRLVSTYNYAQTHIEKYPDSSIAFMSEYSSFDDFIMKWLTPENARSHYFFWPLEQYLCDSSGRVVVDDVIKMEELAEGIKIVEHRLNKKLHIQSMNVSKKIVKNGLDKAVLNRIEDVYRADFELFDYAIEQ